MSKPIQLLALLIAIVWWPSVAHCALEDAGWVASDQCCSEQFGKTVDSDADHAECGACVFESSAMLSIKMAAGTAVVCLAPTFPVPPSGLHAVSTAPISFSVSVDRGSYDRRRQLALPRTCPIRGPSFRS